MEESDKVLYVALLSIPGVTAGQLHYHRLQLSGKLYSYLCVSSHTCSRGCGSTSEGKSQAGALIPL